MVVHHHVHMFYHENHAEKKMRQHIHLERDVWLREVSLIKIKLISFSHVEGGSRTAWNKQWFSHSNPFTTKVDFNRENSWPTPFHYPARPTIGSQSTKVTFPAYSIATRHASSPTLMPENNPAPDTYDTTTAFRKLTAKNTPITLKSRTGGTLISINTSRGNTFSLFKG